MKITNPRALRILVYVSILGIPMQLIAETKVFIPLGSGNTVIQVDANTDKVEMDFGFVSNPHGLAATSDGEYLFAGNLNQDEVYEIKNETFNSSLALVHVFHGHVMHQLPVQGWSHHQAMMPDDSYVLSTHPMEGVVSVMDVISLQTIARIKTDPGPYYVLVSKDGNRAYVSNSIAGTIQEIDTREWVITRTIDAGIMPEHMVMSKDNSRLYVVSPKLGILSEIALNTDQPRKEFVIGKKLHGLDISDDGETLFISSQGTEELVALNIQTGDQSRLKLSPNPYHLNSITGAGKVYVSSRSKPLIWVVDQHTLEVVNTIDLPAGEGHQMAIVENFDG